MVLDAGLILFAFSAGAIAFLNPCGFAMLPTYISYSIERNSTKRQQKQRQLSRHDNSPSPSHSSFAAGIKSVTLVRKLGYGSLVGFLVTLGFIAIFGFTGVGISAAGIGITKFLPWIAVLSGFAIVVLGIAKLFGKTFRINIPRLRSSVYDVENNKSSIGGIGRNYLMFFLFGIGYAIASLSCTLPIFLLIVFQGLSAGGIIQGSIVFLIYAFGMGVVMIAVSVAISISDQTFFVKWLTRLMPKMNVITSLVLIMAGSYLIYYNLVIGKLLIA